MKKTCVFLLCAILLSSCSAGASATPTRDATSTPTDAPTSTPIVPTSTFTLTPTLAAQKTEVSTLVFTPTQITDTPSPTTTSIAILNVAIPGFVNTTISGPEFYKGNACLPVSITFTAQAADPAKTTFVVLFVRFMSKETGVTSKWTSITMESFGAGTFSYELTPSEMKAEDSFQNAWVEYQFVATDDNLSETGHTDIFSERLSLLDCVLTSTPTPKPTATVQKPTSTPNPTATALKP